MNPRKGGRKMAEEVWNYIEDQESWRENENFDEEEINCESFERSGYCDYHACNSVHRNCMSEEKFKGRRRKMCKYFPNCRNGIECSYMHITKNPKIDQPKTPVKSFDQYRNEVISIAVSEETWDRFIITKFYHQNELKSLRKGVRKKLEPFSGAHDVRYYDDETIVGGRCIYEETKESERKEVILSLKEDDRKRLGDCLWKSDFKSVTQLYNEYIGTSNNLNKRTIVGNMVSKFYEEKMITEKREEEVEIISEDDLENIFLEVEDGKYILSRDIMLLILSYLRFDHRLLFQVGSVCKSLYISILSSWGRVKVTKINAYQISILVLKNAKSLFFNAKVFPSQLHHIFSHLSETSFSSIEFGEKASKKLIESVYKSISMNENKNIRFCVTNLSFSPKKKTGRSDLYYLKHVFPNLRRVLYPGTLLTLSGLNRIEHLEFRVDELAGNNLNEYEKVKRGKFPFSESVQSLGIHFHHVGYLFNVEFGTYLEMVLSKFPKVKNLLIRVNGSQDYVTDLYSKNHGFVLLDFSSVSKLQFLEDLQLDFRGYNLHNTHRYNINLQRQRRKYDQTKPVKFESKMPEDLKCVRIMDTFRREDQFKIFETVLKKWKGVDVLFGEAKRNYILWDY